MARAIEFQSEVGRLRAAGKAAFFIPLNRLSDAGSWLLVLNGHEPEFDAWKASDEIGYFFLDSVDEARLTSHSDFERALAIVQRALTANVTRVRVAISLRTTDWSTPGVHTAIDIRLSKPIERAIAANAGAEAQPMLDCLQWLGLTQRRYPQAERLFRALRDAQRGPEVGAILLCEAVIEASRAAA